jgi:sulfatase-modifying factor enzyme 1
MTTELSRAFLLVGEARLDRCVAAIAMTLAMSCHEEPIVPQRVTPVAMDHGRACPIDMAAVGSFCMDFYEAYVVEVAPGGGERPHSPYQGVEGLVVRAKNEKGRIPQGYIAQVQAAAACANAGKRLCNAEEFGRACSGGDAKSYYPYGGQAKIPGYCNEGKGSSMVRLFGSRNWTYDEFNDPRLNQVSEGLASAGSYEKCVSSYGIHDCVGNLHEWGADPPDEDGHGRFRGGFYGDAESNGRGCRYVTSAHGPDYHDYSTGFRCCANASPG